jgi:hypothetical protein
VSDFQRYSFWYIIYEHSFRTPLGHQPGKTLSTPVCHANFTLGTTGHQPGKTLSRLMCRANFTLGTIGHHWAPLGHRADTKQVVCHANFLVPKYGTLSVFASRQFHFWAPRAPGKLAQGIKNLVSRKLVPKWCPNFKT